MIAITPAQIQAARDNDISAISEVLAATEERVGQLAYRASVDNPSWREDAEQIARLTVWECVSTFNGESTAEFFSYIDQNVRGALSAARRSETRQGIGTRQAAMFEAAYRAADGDLDKAEQLATQGEPERRMSPDAARAARLSFEGAVSADKALEGGSTLMDLLAQTLEIPDDLMEPADFSHAQREITRQQVRDVLSSLGDQQRVVLSALTGIAPFRLYGTENDDDLAVDHGIPRQRIKVIRSKGKARFAELYTERYAPHWA